MDLDALLDSTDHVNRDMKSLNLRQKYFHHGRWPSNGRIPFGMVPSKAEETALNPQSPELLVDTSDNASMPMSQGSPELTHTEKPRYLLELFEQEIQKFKNNRETSSYA